MTSSSKKILTAEELFGRGTDVEKVKSQDALYKLKPKIDEPEEFIKEKEFRLSEADVSASSKIKAMDEIKTKINDLESRLGVAWLSKYS